jgi:hypothetical protein
MATTKKAEAVKSESPITPVNDLAVMQSVIRAPKGKYNTFGKYKYRAAEDIMEAAKPICNEMGYALTLTDELVHIGDRYYVKATAMLTSATGITYQCVAYAREEESKKGMDGAQVTGAASSYARKYALSGLLALDDNQDPDATNTGQQAATTEAPKPQQKQELAVEQADGGDVLLLWKQQLSACKTTEDLLDLYNRNKNTIEQYADIKLLFSQRKTQITNGK